MMSRGESFGMNWHTPSPGRGHSLVVLLSGLSASEVLEGVLKNLGGWASKYILEDGQHLRGNRPEPLLGQPRQDVPNKKVVQGRPLDQLLDHGVSLLLCCKKTAPYLVQVCQGSADLMRARAGEGSEDAGQAQKMARQESPTLGGQLQSQCGSLVSPRILLLKQRVIKADFFLPSRRRLNDKTHGSEGGL